MKRQPAHLRVLLLLAGWAAISPTGPARAAAERLRSAVPLRLLEPTAGATLRGGESAALRWEIDDALALAPAGAAIEEWEAFLSFDGGRTFPQRITPHLDSARRTVFWQVPNVPTAEARLLLRFGNEREEHEVLLPHVFRIARGADDGWTVRRFAVGEPARAGERGVVAWAEGDRDGRDWREVRTAALDAGLAAARAPVVRAAEHGLVFDRSSAPTLAAELGAARREPAPRPTPNLSATRPPPDSGDLLLLIQRRNE